MKIQVLTYKGIQKLPDSEAVEDALNQKGMNSPLLVETKLGYRLLGELPEYRQAAIDNLNEQIIRAKKEWYFLAFIAVCFLIVSSIENKIFQGAGVGACILVFPTYKINVLKHEKCIYTSTNQQHSYLAQQLVKSMVLSFSARFVALIYASTLSVLSVGCYFFAITSESIYSEIVVSTFTHISPLHLLFNLLFGVWFCRIIEAYFGKAKTLTVLFLAILANGWLDYSFRSEEVVGISASLYSLTVIAMFVAWHSGAVLLLKEIILVTAVSLCFGMLMNEHYDTLAHILGLGIGLVLFIPIGVSTFRKRYL